jgi:hypothetical protein
LVFLSQQVQDVLKLTVPEDKEGKRETRNYNTEHLQDLQSRLMLVSGNSETGAERVEKFTMVSQNVFLIITHCLLNG